MKEEQGLGDNEHMIFNDAYFMKSVPVKEIEPNISCWYCNAELNDVEAYIEFVRLHKANIHNAALSEAIETLDKSGLQIFSMSTIRSVLEGLKIK